MLFLSNRIGPNGRPACHVCLVMVIWSLASQQLHMHLTQMTTTASHWMDVYCVNPSWQRAAWNFFPRGKVKSVTWRLKTHAGPDSLTYSRTSYGWYCRTLEDPNLHNFYLKLNRSSSRFLWVYVYSVKTPRQRERVFQSCNQITVKKKSNLIDTAAL